MPDSRIIVTLKVFFLVLSVAIVGYFGSLTKSKGLKTTKQAVAENTGIDWLWSASAEENHQIVDAFFHMFAYGMLTLSLYFCFGFLVDGVPQIAATIFLVVFLAAADEYRQTTLQGRDASVIDLACDIVGMFWAFLAYQIIHKIKLRDKILTQFHRSR